MSPSPAPSRSPEVVACSLVVIAVHGSGGGIRQARELRHLQSLLPRHGIATLTYDRRGEGSSSGVLGAAFEQLAGDARAWVARLRENPNVDPAMIGLWALSQGGWIAPLAAAEDAGIAFLIAISPSAVSPSEQMTTYAAMGQLRHAGYPDSVVQQVGVIRRQIDNQVREDGDTLGILALIEGVRGEPWFPLAHLPTPDRDGQWTRIMDFDVRPFLRRLNLPILLIFGQHDRSVPAGASANIWRSCLGSGVNVTMVSIRGMGHSALSAGDNKWTKVERVPAEYERLLIGWVRRCVESQGRRCGSR